MPYRLQLGSGQPTASLAPADTPIENLLRSLRSTHGCGTTLRSIMGSRRIFSGVGKLQGLGQKSPTGVQGWSPGGGMGRSLQKHDDMF